MYGQKVLRGQIWWVNTNKDIIGSVQSMNRPHLVVSNNIGNRNANIVTVIPCTSEEKKKMPMHVDCEINGIQNTILCEQIRTINTDELLNYMFTLEDDMMKKVDKALKITLGIDEEDDKIKLQPVAIHNIDAARYNSFKIDGTLKPMTVKTIEELKEKYKKEINS